MFNGIVSLLKRLVCVCVCVCAIVMAHKAVEWTAPPEFDEFAALIRTVYSRLQFINSMLFNKSLIILVN